ncbi:hypothetical protein GOB94_06890 [Granulicella sp. 5B5]|uniref:hypothetical protein n=1 Tax=Granulicella sp. 5B5 TaxID=1617967 RepID=UPI0015F684A0|nr:hypothetical protein [Granulicella sp. 5B5]QMV18440.1 hypothetical protein GOB94_06890 [Granulicella sp. 5B5]
MRIELPTRISTAKTLIFAAGLVCVQQLEHTSLVFSLFFFAFIMLGNFAFNAGGGFSRVSGAYVFLFTVLTAGLGVTWKAVLGEPADSNLLVPQLDMAIYAASNFALLVVILINKRLTGRSQGIAPGNIDYTLAALGCLVLGLLQSYLNSLGLGGPGSALSIVNQLSEFFPLAIILGTIGAIRDSGGRRSFNFVSLASISLIFIGSMLAFTKQGMFEPLACWVMAAAFTRFKLRPLHYVVLTVVVVGSYVIFPLIAEGRTRVSPNATASERAAVVIDILTHLDKAKRDDAETAAYIVASEGKSGYYNTPQGFIERLSILSADDAFFNYTDKGHYIGFRPIIEDYENFIPHILLPDKPFPIGGNYYAREIGGILAPDDDSTGISFSPMAEAFHVDGWIGIFFVMPAIWLSLLASLDYLCGDLRRSPWGLLIVVYLAHSAAESLLASLIWMSVYGNLGLILAIFFCTHFAPVVGAFFYGGSRNPAGDAAPVPYDHLSLSLPRPRS